MASYPEQSSISVTPAHAAPSSFVARANGWLENAWTRGWLQRPELNPQALLAVSARSTGLDDFGSDDGWRERLSSLCLALREEAALTSVGTTIAYGQLLSALSSRLRAAEMRKRHPEMEEVPLSRPIIVVGQMRSGSTRMQRLLACDRRLTFTRFFESWNPLPRWTHRGIDDRVLRAWLALRVARLLNPKFDVVHPTRTMEPDEEIGLHNIALYGAAFEAQWRIPSFALAGERNDSRPVYEEFRRYLQTIRWLRGDRSDRPWILKVPQFGQDLKTVIDVFPDARIVLLERDPVEVVGSSASLVHNQMAVQTAYVDAAWIGREWLRKTVLRRDRIADGLRHHGAPCVKVTFEDMRTDWRGQMRKVYELLEMPLTTDLENRMASYLGKRRHERLGRHRYDIGHFGLTEAEIRSAFSSGLRQARDVSPQVAA